MCVNFEWYQIFHFKIVFSIDKVRHVSSDQLYAGSGNGSKQNGSKEKDTEKSPSVQVCFLQINFMTVFLIYLCCDEFCLLFKIICYLSKVIAYH